MNMSDLSCNLEDDWEVESESKIYALHMNILYVNFCRFFNKDLGFSEDILGNYMKNILVSGFEENWLNDEEATPTAELETEIDYCKLPEMILGKSELKEWQLDMGSED